MKLSSILISMILINQAAQAKPVTGKTAQAAVLKLLAEGTYKNTDEECGVTFTSGAKSFTLLATNEVEEAGLLSENTKTDSKWVAMTTGAGFVELQSEDVGDGTEYLGAITVFNTVRITKNEDGTVTVTGTELRDYENPDAEDDEIEITCTVKTEFATAHTTAPSTVTSGEYDLSKDLFGSEPRLKLVKSTGPRGAKRLLIEKYTTKFDEDTTKALDESENIYDLAVACLGDDAQFFEGDAEYDEVTYKYHAIKNLEQVQSGGRAPTIYYGLDASAEVTFYLTNNTIQFCTYHNSDVLYMFSNEGQPKFVGTFYGSEFSSK